MKAVRFLLSLAFIIGFSSRLVALDNGASQTERIVTTDLSLGEWTDAYDELVDVLTVDYAFTDWKQIDWQELHEHFRPQILAAEAAGDTTAYFLALREFIFSIPDGHMECLPNTPAMWNFLTDLMNEQIGGSYGFALIRLDDGRIVASIVTDGGPAALAGMQPGAEVLQWNGEPIQTALQNVSELWAYNPAATNEVRRINQYRLIGRAPAGSTCNITFRNPATDTPANVSLTAVSDNLATYWQTHFYPTWPELITPVVHEILESGYGYVKITSESLDQERRQLVMTLFEAAMQDFVAQDVPAVIVDVRRNNGGFDEVAAYIAGFFYDSPSHYEHITYRNAITGNFEITQTITIQPRFPNYTGPVIAMTGPGTYSSGEGIAMAVQKHPRGKVIGFYATNGSFGMAAGRVEMPCGFIIYYTNGQSLDIDGRIQIDSDADMNGGIVPDIRVPIDAQTVSRAFVDGEDVELSFVIDHLNGLTGIEGPDANEDGFQLGPNYPNPFNAKTAIEFRLPRNQGATLEIIDSAGRILQTADVTGRNRYVWEASDAASGVHFYRIISRNFSRTRKMMLIR